MLGSDSTSSSFPESEPAEWFDGVRNKLVPGLSEETKYTELMIELKYESYITIQTFPTFQQTMAQSQGWGVQKIQETYENVHPKLVLVLLFVRTKVELCGEGLLGKSS